MKPSQRVRQGIAFLDEHHKGWHRMLNPYTIDIRAQCHCALAQIFRVDYQLAAEKAGMSDPDRAYRHGFYEGREDEPDIKQRYRKLTRLWRSVARSRLRQELQAA